MIAEILRSYGRTLTHLRLLVEDIADERLGEQPAGVVNHGAWVLGHLASSQQAMAGELGVAPWLPTAWGRRYGTGSVPSTARGDDPSKAELLRRLAQGERALAHALERLGEAGLAQPLPDERYRHEFPSLGDAVLHILTAHAALHVGRLTVWRRALGDAPPAKVFL